MEHPTFIKANNGTLILRASDEAKAVGPQRQGYRAKQPEEVEVEARAHVASEGSDVNNATVVLSRWKVQFGTYQGKTFHWLLQNDVSYAVMVVASHQKEREGTGSQSPLMANKVCQLSKKDGASSRLADGERRPLREEEGQRVLPLLLPPPPLPQWLHPPPAAAECLSVLPTRGRRLHLNLQPLCLGGVLCLRWKCRQN
nr:uncharacterized protein LOC107376411 isoform X2 [Nothobranchius furzeri]XP_054606628.1 uncharacterized protein LOC107376411 isoform X2 [Nothobranchius furzeri]